MIRRPVYYILVLFLFLSVCCNNSTEVITETAPAASDSVIKQVSLPAELLYGIPADSFGLIRGRIKQNTFLSDILVKYGISLKEIDSLLKNSSKIFDVRNIRSGCNYILFCTRDSQPRLKYLVYEHDQALSYIFNFNDSLSITPYYKAISSEIKYATGTIETSLWDAMINGGLHPSLAVSLSEIFAWTVDFFGLQKGDSFKVIYEERFIEGKSIGTGRIYGAQFFRNGIPVTAIPFIQADRESYFDEDGNSLRKAFLKAPLQFSRISSRYSASRLHPILRIRRAHFGVDYAAPVGTPVHSIGDGRVTSAKIEGASGRIVRITHNSVYSTAYLHLSRFEPGIFAGAVVKQGDIIGYVGSSGLSTGPHLDFRFFKNGSPVDPLKVDAPPVEPVADTNRIRFATNKTVVLSLLGTFN
jgi:murein DD-endopeptidase MepM/ murein hydrolase activator NlpD